MGCHCVLIEFANKHQRHLFFRFCKQMHPAASNIKSNFRTIELRKTRTNRHAYNALHVGADVDFMNCPCLVVVVVVVVLLLLLLLLLLLVLVLLLLLLFLLLLSVNSVLFVELTQQFTTLKGYNPLD